MKDSALLTQQVKDLETKRKNGEIDTRQFYIGLLDILANLKDALANENISEADVKKQIPLLLVFIKSQITDMENRGH
ncbi:MAG: hypothetical protein ABGX24_05610 [Aquificota bacterium]|jgi:hypothetical protein